MLTKQLLKGLALFLICLICDQVSKELSLNFSSASENSGFIFGLASDLPSSLRIIGLSSIFGFLFVAYLLLMYFLPIQLMKLKMGLSFLAGGIFGNVVDRVFRGTSLDFIPLPTPFMEGQILFNLADAFQWIGAILIVYNVIVHEKIIWYPENQRGQFLIHPKEQIRFSIKMTLAGLCSSLLLGLFSSTYLRNTLVELKASTTAPFLIFVLAYLSLTLLFGLIIFGAGIILSHRTAGPFYAFEQYIEDLLEGNDRPFLLREGDNYRHLEQVASRVRRIILEKEDR